MPFGGTNPYGTSNPLVDVLRSVANRFDINKLPATAGIGAGTNAGGGIIVICDRPAVPFRYAIPVASR